MSFTVFVAVVFPACAIYSSALGLCSGWAIPLHCPPLTWGHIHSQPLRPSSGISCKHSLSPRLLCTHISRLCSAPASKTWSALSLPTLWPVSALGLMSVFPEEGRALRSHPWVPEPAGDGWGRLGLGLGGQKQRSRGSSCWHHGVLGPVPDTSVIDPPCPLSTRRQSLGSCRGGSRPHPGCPGPRLPQPQLCAEHK